MGSFVSTVGDYSIPQDKQKEFQERVLHVMNIGGMMRLGEVRIYDKSVYLLIKASELDDECHSYWASYNYFEDDMWEDAGYNPIKHYVFSNKLGWSTFNNVMATCHMLQELYSNGGCYMHGDLYMDPLEIVHWINKEFKTNFDLDHRLDMLKIYHAIKKGSYYGSHEVNVDDLADYAELYDKEVGFTESSRDALRKELLETKSAEDVEKFFRSQGKEYAYGPNENATRNMLFALALAEASTKYDYSFSTKDLLRCDSDDDRLYWWSDGAFELSPECHEWLADIKEKHQQIMDGIRNGDETEQDMIKKLVVLLEHINEVYRHMYMFKESFYDILAKANSAEARAAVKLLENICVQGEPKMKELLENNNWHSIRCSEPRREMKRYLALLGNRELRKKMLSF